MADRRGPLQVFDPDPQQINDQLQRIRDELDELHEGSSSEGPVLRGYLAGFGLANGSDATNDITIAAGEAASDDSDPDDRVLLVGAAMTKQLDAVWAAGSGQGGRHPSEGIADDTWHVFAFRRSGGDDDYFFSRTLTPTPPDGGTTKRRLGSIVRASSAIRAFVQDGDLFQWLVPILDVDATNPGTDAVTATLSIPTDVRHRAVLNVYVIANVSNALLYVSDLSATDSAPSATAAPLANTTTVLGANNGTEAGMIEVMTNTSAQVRYRLGASVASTVVRMATRGWFDRRGRDD